MDPNLMCKTEALQNLQDTKVKLILTFVRGSNQKLIELFSIQSSVLFAIRFLFFLSCSSFCGLFSFFLGNQSIL